MAKVWAADEEVEVAILITVEGPLPDGGAEDEGFEAVELVELVMVVDLEILDVLVVVAVFVGELVEVPVVEMTIDRAVDEDPLYPRE
jgi:hypothetical protein